MKKTLMMFTLVALLGVACMLLPSCRSRDMGKMENSVREDSFTFSFVDPNGKAGDKPQSYVVQYLTPVDADGQSVPGAENIICYIPWLGEEAPFKDPDNRYYAEKLGFTIFAIPDPGYPPTAVLLAVQDELTRKLKLPPRKLLLYGASSGATTALNASIEFPDRIDAIAAHSPRRWYKINSGVYSAQKSEVNPFKPDRVGRLFTHNWYDGARDGVEAILADLRAQQMIALTIQTPPYAANVNNSFYHRGPGPFSQELFHRYFADIVALRDANNGELPLQADWPETLKQTAAALRFPGPLLLEYCRNLPHDAAKRIGKNGDLPGSSVKIEAVSGDPVAAAVVFRSSDFASQMNLLNYAWQLATAGNVDTFAATAAMDTQVDSALFQEMLAQAQATKLPIYVIALGRVAETVLANLPENRDGKLKRVTIAGIPWRDSLNAAHNIPVVMYFDAPSASDPSLESKIIGVNTGAPAGFGTRILTILQEAVAPEIPKAEKMTTPRQVNNLPALLEQAKKLEAAIPAKGGTAAIQAYINAQQAIRPRATELYHAGVITPEQYFFIDTDLLASQVKYWQRSMSGKSPEEVNASRQKIEQDLNAILTAYQEYIQNKINSGGTVEKDQRLVQYHRKIIMMLNRVEKNLQSMANIQRQRDLARQRGRADAQRYTPEQLKEIEKIYSQAAKNLQAPEAPALLRQLVANYPDSNRAGNAVMYLAQLTEGDEQLQYLQTAIDKHSDCFYYNGNQVGAQARYYLAMRYRKDGKMEKAQELLEQIKNLYPDAVNHRGARFSDIIAAQEKQKTSPPAK